MSRAIFTDAGSWGGGYAGTRVEYAASDLGALTQLTIDGYLRVDDFEVSGPTTGVPLIQHGLGIPGDTGFPLGSYGTSQIQVSVNSDGYFSVRTNSTLIGTTSSGGLITEGVAFHWMCTWDFGAAAGHEVKLYVNGVSAPLASPSSPAAGVDQVGANIDAFDDRATTYPGEAYSYYHGGLTVDGIIKPCSVDYVRIWNGVTATSGQAAEYGGAYRVDSGTLGAPNHLWDFDGDCEDTGTSPLTLVSTREVTFSNDPGALHPLP